MRNRILIWAIVLVVVFLLGFVPSYSKSARLESELRQSAERTDQLELRDLAGRVYIQAVEKNFGLAGQTANQFFSRVQEVVGKAADRPDVKKRYDELFGSRDKVVIGLGKGDPGVINDIRELYARTVAATTR